MSYRINNTEDVYKFTQVLYDYLNINGHTSMASSLSSTVDGCFATSEEALKAHKQALSQIQHSHIDLPEEHHQAVERSLEILDRV